jgi:hypothetical protein
MSEKSRFYAYFFSIILPGLGQIYLNHKNRGLYDSRRRSDIIYNFIILIRISIKLDNHGRLLDMASSLMHFSSTNLKTKSIKKTRLVNHKMPESIILESLLINYVK